MLLYKPCGSFVIRTLKKEDIPKVCYMANIGTYYTLEHEMECGVQLAQLEFAKYSITFVKT